MDDIKGFFEWPILEACSELALLGAQRARVMPSRHRKQRKTKSEKEHIGEVCNQG